MAFNQIFNFIIIFIKIHPLMINLYHLINYLINYFINYLTNFINQLNYFNFIFKDYFIGHSKFHYRFKLNFQNHNHQNH